MYHEGGSTARTCCCCSAIPSVLTAKRTCPHYGDCDIDAARAGKTSGTQQLTRRVYENRGGSYLDGSEARRGIDAYLDLYNRERPHQFLGYRTPAQVFAEGRPLRCLPDQASALSSREVVSDFPAGVSLNLAPSLS